MAAITSIRIRRPDDFHVHLREGDVLRRVLPYTADVFKRALVMPNLKDPVTTVQKARAYREEILRLSEGTGFEPLMTMKLTQRTTSDDVQWAKEEGIVAFKLYPEGVTTNSEDGVSDLGALHKAHVFKAMAHHGIVLCVHAEQPGVFSMDRETAFLRELEPILRSSTTGLKTVIEHVTTRYACEWVRTFSQNVAATITIHHLLLTLDDVVGDKLRPHNFCKPIAKTREDRDAILTAAISGHERFFLGTDSAPHAVSAKECADGCAGCFTAPWAMERLATIFDDRGALLKLEAFTSEFGAKFYGLPLTDETILLKRAEEPFVMPITGVMMDDLDLPIQPWGTERKLGWLVSDKRIGTSKERQWTKFVGDVTAEDAVQEARDFGAHVKRHKETS